MFVARSIAADHRDLIHDVSFDFHGRRMATCSSDQSVKVWDKSENGDWHCTASWKTHSGSVWRVTWAHPEFGQVLASCSFDRTAVVWEEIVGESNDKLRGQSHWVKRTTLVDSRTSVTDVKFAPKHMGLMLATCSADGVVRIYEAPDVMNLSQWSLQHEISCKLSCSCISWNPSSSRAHSPMIAVGSDDNSPNILAKVQIYEYNENTRKYAKAETLMTVTDPVHDIAFAPNLGRSFHILAVATKDVRIFTLKPVRKELTSSGGLTKFEIQIVAQFDNHNSQVWRVSWNITGTVLASSGDDGCVRLWKANYMDNWKCTGILKGNGSPVNGSSQQGMFNASIGSATTSLQNSLNGSAAGRYFFPPLDSPRAGSRWSSYAQLLPPPPLIEHSCDADTANLQYPHPSRRYISQPLNLLPENEGVYSVLLYGMMEDFRNIADETFPSFLANSLNSNTSGILENVTISSNLGLPVAASTVARAKTGCENRLSDVQASYLEEGRFSLPSASSPTGQSASEPKGKLALSFQGDLGITTLLTEAHPVSDDVKESSLIQKGHKLNAIAECSSHSQDTLFDILPIEHLEDLSIGICALPQSQKENKIDASEPEEKLVEGEILSDQFSTSLSGFLENEKLLSLESLEGNSTDDDIDDEEFYDNQLEAYFKQLVLPGMLRGDNEGQELSECSTALKLSENGLNQENFQVPHIHQTATGMDSATASDEDSYELEKAVHHEQREPFLLPRTIRQLMGEMNRPSFRPELEGNSSAESSVGTAASNSRIEYSQSAEDQVIGPPVPENACGLGDLGSEGAALVPLYPPDMQIFNIGRIGRNVTGEETEDLVQAASEYITPDDIPTHNEDAMNGGDALNSISVAEFKLDSLYLQHMDSNKTDAILEEKSTTKRTQSSNLCHAFSSDAEEILCLADGVLVYDTPSKIPVSENAAITDTNPVNECELGLADTYLSPTAGGRATEYYHTTEEVNSAFYDPDDPPHSIVYQNEEGKWVTDLAYYTSFDKEQALNLPADSKISEDFIAASEAIAKIAQDQEEFEREHRFIQEEKIDPQNTSEVEDTSWKSASSYNLLRASQTTSDLSKDASYLRLSLGEFFGQRSEALGCLGGGSDVRRPSFGYHITSPEKRQPVALLRQSDASRGNSDQENSQISDTLFSEVHTKEHPDSVSATFTVGEMETTAGINKNINTQTAAESKIEERLDKSKFEDKLPDLTDSILSMSTIASAIANASASAEPSQLAAMIMALSNKNREKLFLPETGKDTDLSFINPLLSSNEEKPNGFNMEKYLKKTEEAGHESEPENITRYDASVHDLMWDSSLPYKHKSQDTLAAELLNSNLMKQGGAKCLLDCTESLYEENDTQDSSCASDFPENKKKTVNNAKHLKKSSDLIMGKHPQPKRTSLTSNVLDAEKTSSENETHNFLNAPATKKEMVCRGKCASVKQFASQTNSLPNLHINYSSESKGTTHHVPRSSNDLVKRETVESTVSTNSLKLVQQSSIQLPISHTKAKSTQKLSKDEKRQGGKMQKNIREASLACSNNVKHVTFEKPSVTSPRSIDQKPLSSECDMQSSEDEQYSFRPSTSPLIHSSPSEASGTTLSGSETDSPCTAPYFQTSACNDNTLTQSVCSSPSMSRLTYVSATDNTLKNIAVIPSSARRGSNNASELSTTIIRASPTPLVEETTEKPEDFSWQRNRRGTSLNTSPRNVNEKLEVNESTCPSNKLEDGVSDHKLSRERLPRSENEFTSSLPNIISSQNEIGHVNPTLSSKSSILQPLYVHVDTPVAWQDHTNKTKSPASLNMVPTYSGLGAYIPVNQNTCSEQYIPISSFKSHGSPSETQTLSSAIPILLSGRSLTTTAFAQQYLGNMQSSGNVALPQYVGSCTSCGLPAGLPCSGIPAGHIQNSVTMGIPLGPSIGPGLLGTPSLCNPRSASWNHILSTESYTGQSTGTSGNERWEPSGFGHVRVPEELKFPNACCVGIASQTNLGIFNPTERWLQVCIGIFSISINGEKMDPLKYQCLVFKNKTIIGPHSTEELKMLFLPCHPGIFQCVLSISSWPVSADAETIVQAEALATRVVLTAVAENPILQVETGKTDVLDFGDLTSGSWKALPLKLINKTHASVPIRLIIKANAVAWRCFTFSKEPVNTFIECAPQTDAISQLAAPSVVNHVIHASYDGQDPEILEVWVLFHAPKKQISGSDTLGPADEFLARVDVEVDSPGPTSVIKSIPLRARAGTARIHAPKDLQTMCLSASVGSSAKQKLPLKNAGNIEIYLKIKTSCQDNCISVEPEDLFLMPGEEQEVAVLFSPKDLKNSSESILKILVLPSGPQYEVVVKGEVNILGNRPLAMTSYRSDIPPILSNKQFMAWGGVALGRTVQQKLTLRNNSPSTTQHLRLVIRGQDQDCFQLRSTFGTEERLTSNRELKIRPREDSNIFLMFTPSHVACMLAKLEIKQLGIQSQPGVKFTIPLSGYGGTSNVILENVKKLSDSYMVTLNGLPDKLREVSVHIRNMGSRAAYVKALCFRDLQSKAVMDPKVMVVSPEKFVLKEGTQEVVTVTCNPMEREEMLYKTSTSLLSTICFFCGDEVSRQQYRRAVLYKEEAAKQILPENSILRNIKFDEEFRGEQLVTEVYDLPQRTNDIELFYGNMRKVILSVVGVTGDSSFKRDCLQQPPRHSLESDRLASSETHTNSTLDVLPVKGPQGPPLSLNTDDPVQNKLISRETWTIQPEHLILTSPSISGTAGTGRIQIMNNCNRSLKFELSWPAHCLTITPQHGVIEPQNSILILVSPNPSLATKPSVFPWSGLIYIHCDSGQKLIKVQIQEDITQDISSTGLTSKKLDVLTPASESIIHMIKPLPKLPSTKVEIRNRTIVFPETGSGESSENYLEIENHGDEAVKWYLSSFAPPYVKGVDGSGDVYRATYTAFRCSRVSGTLEAHRKEKLAITFLPRDRGDYAQFWDLECHPLAEPHMKHKIRFQLSGVGAKTENETVNAKVYKSALIKTEIPVMPRRGAGSEASTLKIGQNEIIRGVYAREDIYTFLPTRIGESSTLKVNLRNNTFTTHMLKFVNPREPFHIKHSKYSLRSQHYINLPVQFKPKSAGRFEGLLVVQIDKCGSLGIRLLGEAHTKK
ncbi:centrosomal protein of 192 kDa [Emydura macquarii macquarii]|uniref:centrosomal protein of 192 kDa n=1 Tax=Emydura macquarii macquarii TaxID=1129001 RepID=UPI00352B882E